MRGFIPTIEPHQSTQTHARRPEPRPSRGDRDAFREAFVQAQERHRSARAPRAANSRQGSAAIDGATDPTRNGDRHLKVAGASRDKKGALSPRAEDAASPGPDKTSTNSPGDGDLTGALNTTMAAAHAPAPAGEGSDASLGAVADNHADRGARTPRSGGDQPRSWWRCRRGRRGESAPKRVNHGTALPATKGRSLPNSRCARSVDFRTARRPRLGLPPSWQPHERGDPRREFGRQ